MVLFFGASENPSFGPIASIFLTVTKLAQSYSGALRRQEMRALFLPNLCVSKCINSLSFIFGTNKQSISNVDCAYEYSGVSENPYPSIAFIFLTMTKFAPSSCDALRRQEKLALLLSNLRGPKCTHSLSLIIRTNKQSINDVLTRHKTGVGEPKLPRLCDFSRCHTCTLTELGRFLHADSCN